jgi:cytochrome P450
MNNKGIRTELLYWATFGWTRGQGKPGGTSRWCRNRCARSRVECDMTMPPGPRGWETLGFFGGGSAGGILAFLANTSRRYGPVSGFRVLNARIYVIDEPALIDEILVRRQHSFVRDTGATLLRELVGDGLLTSEEPRHRERRRMLQPAFHRAHIAAYAGAMVAEAARTADEWATRSSIDVGVEMRRLTLSVVGSALFGADMRASADAVAAVLARVTRKVAGIAALLAFCEPLLLAYRRRFPHGPSLLFGPERRELEKVIAPIVAQRRVCGGRDIVSLLLAERDERGAALTDEDVRNEVVTLVLAGHETTATALTWAWYLLATHPAVAAKLHAELDAVLGDREPNLDDVAHLTYTAAVFSETLRLYPSAPAFGRRPVADVTLGGYTIPRGSSIFVSPYITQRNPRWFADPDAFVPERWVGTPPPKFAYFPFGGGAKMCIGEPFSKLEGVLVLATLARRLDLNMIDDAKIGVTTGPTLRPERPIFMRPSPRSSAPNTAPSLPGEPDETRTPAPSYSD